MPNPSDPRLLTRNHAPVPDETTIAGLTVEGTLPTALTGRYVRIGPNPVAPSATAAGRSLDGMVHAVELHAGHAVGYRNRWVTTDHVARTLGTDPVPGPPAAAVDVVATNVITFGGRTLALGPGALAYELDEHLGTVGRVDLAGHGRGIGAHPQVDPLTGALHLVSYGDEPAIHTVAPERPDPHHRPRARRPWPATGSPPHPRTPRPVGRRFRRRHRPHRHSPARLGRGRPPRRRRGATTSAATVTVLTASGPLMRWTFTSAGARCDVLDDTAQRFGTSNPERASRATYLWTVAAAGGTGIYRHDLRGGDRVSHDLGPGRHPGAMTFVPDPTRRHREDGGWLIGLAHDDDRNEADLIVLDAAAIDRPPVASIRIPRRIPYGLRGTWIPFTRHFGHRDVE